MTTPQTASRTFICTTLAAFCVVGCWGGAVGARADDAVVRHEIEAAHVQQVRADTGGDAALWRQMYQNVVTPDYTFTLGTGQKESREQFQKRYLRLLPFMKGGQEAFHVQQMTQNGHHATEDGFLTYGFSITDAEGKMGPKGKTHIVTGRNTYRARWTKVGTSWKLAEFHLLKHEEQTDGKPSGN